MSCLTEYDRDAVSYRLHAEHWRARAEEMVDPTCRLAALHEAEMWDRMADKLDRGAKSA